MKIPDELLKNDKFLRRVAVVVHGQLRGMPSAPQRIGDIIQEAAVRIIDVGPDPVRPWTLQPPNSELGWLRLFLGFAKNIIHEEFAQIEVDRKLITEASDSENEGETAILDTLPSRDPTQLDLLLRQEAGKKFRKLLMIVWEEADTICGAEWFRVYVQVRWLNHPRMDARSAAAMIHSRWGKMPGSSYQNLDHKLQQLKLAVMKRLAEGDKRGANNER